MPGCRRGPQPVEIEVNAPCVQTQPPATDEVPDVASLKTPESPAFVALGLAPTEIQRPVSPSGLVASLSQGLRQGEGPALLRNFALEFAPYWLLSHPYVSYEDRVANPQWEWLRRFSISVATSPGSVTLIDEDGGETEVDTGRVAIGAQTTLLPGVPTHGARACMRYLRHYTATTVLAFDAEVAAFERQWIAHHPQPQVLGQPKPPRLEDYTTDGLVRMDELNAASLRYQQEGELWLASNPTYADYTAWDGERELAVQRFKAEYDARNPFSDPRALTCLNDVNARAGFMVATAAARTLELPNGDLNKLDDGGTDSWQGWLTAGYVFEDLGVSDDPTEFSLLAAFRGSWITGSPESRAHRIRRLDAGLRAGLGLERVGVAVEGTYRDQQRELGTEDLHERLYRLGLSVDYRLSGGMWLSGSFGKDFGDTEDEAPLFILANLQWNFGFERTIEPQGVTQ